MPTSAILWSPDHTNVFRRLSTQPWLLAGLLTVGYLLTASLYVMVSGQLAERAAVTKAELEQIETVKGITFVVVTGCVHFGLTFVLLRHINRQHAQILRQQQTIVVTESRALAGIFAASIAHDMNNVLTIIRNYADLLQEDLDNVELQDDVGTLVGAVDDLCGLADRLTRMGRSYSADDIRSCDLAELVRATAEVLAVHPKARDCRLLVTGPESLAFRGKVELIKRMIVNLVLNAADATGRRGTIQVRLRQAGSAALIEVHDNGPGIPEESWERVFEAFHTTKPDGTGLGLLSVRLCAREHGGTVEVGRSDLGGARLQVALWSLDAPAAQAALQQPVVTAV